MQPGVFYELRLAGKPHFFLPTRTIRVGSNLDSSLIRQEHSRTNFSVEEVKSSLKEDAFEAPSGFLFYSNLPVKNYSTALMAYSVSWQQFTEYPSVEAGELFLCIRNPHFYLYHATSKLSFVTCATMDDRFVDFLTCI